MKKHILIVDDEQNIREVCKELLEEEGYKVTLAVDGQDALEKMDFDVFDLFLVDMAMPRMDGLELMKMIKKKQPLAVIIILENFYLNQQAKEIMSNVHDVNHLKDTDFCGCI